MDRIDVMLPSHIHHICQIVTGFLILKEQGMPVVIRDCSRDRNQPLYDLPVVTAQYGGKRIVYDLWDGYQNPEGMQLAGVAKIEELSLVDYGGGCGFFSLLASRAGVGKVIYVDLNPRSVETVRILKERLGFGPDVIIEGDAYDLEAWLHEEKDKPQLIVGTDVIEHIYDVMDCFYNFVSINKRIAMIFTTASTPYNPWVKRRLYRWMDEAERGTGEQPNYWTLRREYFRKKFPMASDEELDYWADITRGQTYEAIDIGIEENDLSSTILPGPHNTCDPRTGNWMERILPIAEYRKFAAIIGYRVDVGKGFYNERRANRAASLVCRLLNGLIRCSGKLGLLLAPFIVLRFRKKGA